MTKTDLPTADEAFDRLFHLLVDLNVVDSAETESTEELQTSCVTSSVAIDSSASLKTLTELTSVDPVQNHFEPLVESNSSEPTVSEAIVPQQLEMIFPACDSALSSDEAFSLLQALLIDPKLDSLHEQIRDFRQQIESQLYEPEQLIELILPLIAEVLQRKTTQPHEDLVQAIAPTMGEAIKKQIQIEPDAIVDALYPIIGGTISKYLAETVREINQQIENSLSIEGIQRKIKAKLKGVSEAELILQKAMPLTVQAAFLIHKTSGLMIAEMQRSDEHQLESDMIAGMLTAIRSFANDCIAQSGQTSELNAIDYGSSKIVLEVAGYCYLAIVIQGEPSKPFLLQVRKAFGSIVQQNGAAIEQFDGDYATVPASITSALRELGEIESVNGTKTKKLSPLMILGIGLLSLIVIPTGIGTYHDRLRQQLEIAFTTTPELAVYHLNTEAWFGKLKLSGQLPNVPLRDRADRIARSMLPNWTINNQITVVDVPADPVLTEAEVKRVTAVLNQTLRITIAVVYRNAQVSVEGTVSDRRDADRITQAYQSIPGVKSVINTVRIQPLVTEVRLYFSINSSIVGLSLDQTRMLKTFLRQHRERNFMIVGYSSELPLAIARAQSVKAWLIRQGISPNRLQITGSNQPPNSNQEDLSRSTLLKII